LAATFKTHRFALLRKSSARSFGYDIVDGPRVVHQGRRLVYRKLLFAEEIIIDMEILTTTKLMIFFENNHLPGVLLCPRKQAIIHA